MKCVNCGAELKVGCIHCSSCGHEAQIVPDYNVLEDDLFQRVVEEEERQKRLSEKRQMEKLQKQVEEQKKRTKIITGVVIGVTLLVIIIGVAVYFVLHSKKVHSFDYQYDQGVLAMRDHDYRAAKSYLEAALEMQPEHEDIMLDLAQIYKALSDDASEEGMLLQLIALDQRNATAYSMLIELYDRQGNYDKIKELQDKLSGTDLEHLVSGFQIDIPEFSVEPGTFDEEFDLELKAQNNCKIYYSIGKDSDPITEGKLYEDAINIPEGTVVIRAVAKDERELYSEVITGEYTVTFVAPKPPMVHPGSGTYREAETIEVSADEDCAIYYTWDGTNPTEASTPYTEPLSMPEGNNVLALIAVDKHGLISKVVKYNYIYLPSGEVISDSVENAGENHGSDPGENTAEE